MSCIYSFGSHNISNSRNRKVSDISSDNGKITFEADKNDDSQLWEVLPYWTDDYPYGLVIRLKVMVDDSGVGKSLYLSYDNGKIIATTDRDPFCRINLPDIADWVRFGKMYITDQKWISLVMNDKKLDFDDLRDSLENYESNKTIIPTGFISNTVNLQTETSVPKSCITDILLEQSSGHFLDLKFGEAIMSEVACEIIATYNALKMKKYISNDTDYDCFLRLATEFELGAMKGVFPFDIPPISDKAGVDSIAHKGVFGSEPREIGRCLEAYNAPYKRFDRNYYDGSHKFAAFQMDSEVNNGDVVIL